MMTYPFKLGAAALVMAPFLAMKALAVPTAPVTINADPDVTDPSVIVFDQRAGSNAVTLSYAYLPDNGYVAIYGTDDDGKPTGEVLGYTPLEAGSHMNVAVEIGQELESGQTFWASLYKGGEDGDQTLDTSEGAAFWPEGKPLENRFDVL